MNLSKIKKLIRKVLPSFVISYIQRRREKIDLEFANFILNSAIEYSKHIGGDSTSFDKNLKNLIIKPKNNCNSIIQDVLIAFMPDFERNLFQFYKNQEYLIFYRFLTYPFQINMNKYLIPYCLPLEKISVYDVIDYGAGIPYGIIYSLRKKNHKINSITLIDLDLIHVEFVEFLIKKIDPNVKLNIIKVTDTNNFPLLEGKFNFFFGKDVFEHLSDPLKNLKELMNYSKPDAVCYFDFRDYGEKIYQHITPNVDFLSDEMIKMGFKKGKDIYGMTEFTRNI